MTQIDFKTAIPAAQAFYDIRTRLERMKLIVVEGNMVRRRME